MNEIQYIGEHLWLGKIGHFLIILSFVTALFSSVSYFFNVQRAGEAGSDKWKLFGRIGYIVHGISVIGIFSLIMYAMVNKYFEYIYVYDHVSSTLPMKYILSAFWEGQEGSFQLWMIWHIVLGFIILFRGGKWEAPVMAVIALIEVVIASMLLGLHIEIGDFAYKVGSNPFLLIREVTEAPIFSNADYLSLIEGRGLNPLLQNYWNIIHPPVLFIGFSSTAIPFAFAIAGLWKGEHREWLKPALPWCLFSAAILGTGILMGSAWAYEALTFGGYWAWDPVENAVLVPWLTLVAGIHTHLIARNTKYSVKSTYFFYLLSFVFILYSTFLTRSGILGESSAHAFTEMGLEWQLVGMVSIFALLGFGLLLYKIRTIDSPKVEESLYSREFWMFIGSLVLFFSSILIITSTSLPVFNTIIKSFDPNYVGRVIEEPIPHYDRYQMWIAVLISFLSGMTLFLRYKEKKQKITKVITSSSIAFVLAVILTYLFTIWLNLYSWQYFILAVSGFFAVFINIDYLVRVAKGNLKLSSSALAHLGFGLMVIGILASGLNKSHISSNPFAFKDVFEQEDLSKYIQLIKGQPMFSKGYLTTYEGDTLIGRDKYYSLLFEKLDKEGEVTESFRLSPSALLSNDFTKVAALNPDTKHYLHKDIFVNIASLPKQQTDVKFAKEMEDTMKFVQYNGIIGDTIFTELHDIVMHGINLSPSHPEYDASKHDMGVGIPMSVTHRRTGFTKEIQPVLGLDGSLLYNYAVHDDDLSMRVKLSESMMDSLFVPDHLLNYETYKLKNNESISVDDMSVRLSGFDRNPVDDNYSPAEGDIAVAAILSIERNGKEHVSRPLYVIRNNVPMSIKKFVPEVGLHIRFSNIDPSTETFSFKIAREDVKTEKIIPIEVAENLPPNNFIILEARLFPGINLFWLGTVLMMIGLFMAWIIRRRAA